MVFAAGAVGSAAPSLNATTVLLPEDDDSGSAFIGTAALMLLLLRRGLRLSSSLPEILFGDGS